MTDNTTDYLILSAEKTEKERMKLKELNENLQYCQSTTIFGLGIVALGAAFSASYFFWGKLAAGEPAWQALLFGSVVIFIAQTVKVRITRKWIKG
ncbi:MAG: hypothetical protein ABIT47_01295 [Candidatus Paceibacterota bacterium]